MPAWPSAKFGKAERARAPSPNTRFLLGVDHLRNLGRRCDREGTRYRVPHRGRLYKVDVSPGDLAGLVLAELRHQEDVPDSTSRRSGLAVG